MRKSHFVGVAIIVLISMAGVGLWLGSLNDGNIYLSMRDDPDDDSGVLYEVWEAKHDIKRGSRIYISDFKIAERGTFSLPQEAVRVWITHVDWKASKDIPEGQILMETFIEPTDQKKLKDYLIKRLKKKTQTK